jgi:hypothetical protein
MVDSGAQPSKLYFEVKIMMTVLSSYINRKILPGVETDFCPCPMKQNETKHRQEVV